MNIDELMNELREKRAAVDLIRMDMAAAIDEYQTPEQKAMLAMIEAENEAIAEEFAPMIEAANAAAVNAESAVKAAIIELGTSYKAAGLNAVYSKPRVKWDTKVIDGYAINHPELFAFRTEGAPSVSIRVVK